MKNKSMKTFGTILAILMIAAFANISVFAQDKNDEQSNENQTPENSSQNRNARLLEGSWNVQVTRRNCQTGEATASFPTMSNFNFGGTMNDYGIAMAPAGRGPSFGVWNHQSGRHFTNNFQFFLFGADGVTTGRQIVRRRNSKSAVRATNTPRRARFRFSIPPELSWQPFARPKQPPDLNRIVNYESADRSPADS